MRNGFFFFPFCLFCFLSATRYPSPTLTTNLLPTQLYIFSSVVLPLLRASSTEDDPALVRRLKQFESVRDLVGWIARSNWRKRGTEDVALSSCCSSRASRRHVHNEGGGGGRELAMGRSTTQAPTYRIDQALVAGSGQRGGGGGVGGVGGGRQPVGSTTSEPQTPGTTTPTPALVSRHSWLDSSKSGGPAASLLAQSGAQSHAQSRSGAGGCKVVVWTDRDGFCARGNTVAGFVELNRAVRLLFFFSLSLSHDQIRKQGS